MADIMVEVFDLFCALLPIHQICAENTVTGTQKTCKKLFVQFLLLFFVLWEGARGRKLGEENFYNNFLCGIHGVS